MSSENYMEDAQKPQSAMPPQETATSPEEHPAEPGIPDLPLLMHVENPEDN